MVQGAQAMAALGALDQIDFLSPMIYPYPGQTNANAAATAVARLGNSSMVRKRDGSRFSLVPNPSWLTYNDMSSQVPYCSPGPGAVEWQCPLNQSHELAQAQVAAIVAWNGTAAGAGAVSQIIFWSGDDLYPEKQRARWTHGYANLTMAEWFETAVHEHDLVPPECRQ